MKITWTTFEIPDGVVAGADIASFEPSDEEKQAVKDWLENGGVQQIIDEMKGLNN